MSAEINTENFQYLCGLNGLRPSQVPRRIRRAKNTLYRALRNPSQYKPTMQRLQKLLRIREVPCAK